MYDLAIKNGKIYGQTGWIFASIYIKDGRIANIGTDEFEAKEKYDASGLEVLPGLIDPHVHFALDLGHIQSRDDFNTGSIAATYGGVTSIIDFLAPTRNEIELREAFNKRKNEAGQSHIDYHLHATICNPNGNLEKYVLEMKKLGMHTLKLFTTYSDSNRRTGDNDIIELLKLSKKHNFLLLAHIENDELIVKDKNHRFSDLPSSRPSISETSEALKLAGFVRRYGGHLYMVHLSSGETLRQLKEQYSDIIHKNLYIESCPHYFVLSEDDLNKPDGYLYTCAPPLRSKYEQKLLHELKGDIDTIGTDHCAFNIVDKKKEKLNDMPLGIGGIEQSFTLMRRIYGDEAILRMSLRVAQIMGLKDKGTIDIGHDADLAFFKPMENYKIQGHHGATDYSLYEGMKGAGLFVSTIIRGRFVLKDGNIITHQGQWITGNEIL